MISEKQLEANRRNAQRSTGPRTPHGKARTSLNACRHNLTGQINVFTPDDREVHDKFCDELIEGFNAETAHERQIAQSTAENYWRLNRARAIENNLFALGFSAALENIYTESQEIDAALTTAQTFGNEAKQFRLLTLYEQRINRNLQKNLQQLESIQATRKADRQAAFEDAKLLAQLSLSQLAAKTSSASAHRYSYPHHAESGKPVLVNGFVFSNAEINRAINHDNGLNEAKQLSAPETKRQKEPLTLAS